MEPITKTRIEIYIRYKGDEDALVYSASSEERCLVHGEIWKLLRRLEQALFLIDKGLASEAFEAAVVKELDERFSETEAVQMFKQYVGGADV